VTYALRSVATRTTKSDDVTSRDVESSLAGKGNYLTDTSEEDVEEPDDNWGKMWREISQLSRCGPKNEAAAGNLIKTIREM
jgi:hypothetical protein